MKFLSILFFAFCFLSCEQKTVLEFDQIDYYRIKYSKEHEGKVLFQRDAESENLWLLISDSDNLINISAHYNKKKINPTLNAKIAALLENDKIEFNEASVINSITICEPRYRDILIFKKKNDTVGFAKICFNCDQNNFKIGNNSFRDTNLHYEKVQKVLDSLAFR